MYSKGKTDASINGSNVKEVSAVNPVTNGVSGLTSGYTYLIAVSYYASSFGDTSAYRPTVSSGGTLIAASNISYVADPSAGNSPRAHVMCIVKATATTIKLNLKNVHGSYKGSWWSVIRLYTS